MNNKKCVFIIIGVFVLFCMGVQAETKKLKDIGRYKLVNIQKEMPTEEIFQTLVDKFSADIQNGFNIAGYGNLSVSFIDQVKQSAYTEKELAVGDKMVWMLFRSGGKVKVVHDLEWAGNNPLSVYSFTVVNGGKNYEFIMPKACGNISLQRVEMASPDVAGELEYAETPEQEQEAQDEYDVEKAKIFQEIYDLLNETDLYCSFFILDEGEPDTKIFGAERAYERVQFNNGDIVYINKGRNDGIEEGQMFTVLEVGEPIPGYGPLVHQRGRVRVVALEENASSARVEKACGPVMIGNYLVPFEEKEGRMGKDLGYDVPPYETDGLKGKILYLKDDFIQAGSGAWGLLNLGEVDGIQLGQQLVVYRKLYEGTPLFVFGNMVVIDTQKTSCTVKILSCKDALLIGDLVQTR
ncbi:MAG: hypothetical protein JSV17_09145 [Candidatus Aminicenantes bacterium]|nr:MAG: hypothetical protein JSV17_09145 [Candidatus Aminicenantes bacterium]